MNNSKSLKEFNTFGLDVISKNFNTARNEDQIFKFLNNHSNDSLVILGGGSNILFKNDIERPILKIEIKGINILKEDSNFVYVSVGAGENWNDFVNWSLEKNYGGIENLSLIPGNVGSAPIQNIGAYGVELETVFNSCRAISIKSKELKIFKKEDCNFSYRSSIFKEELKNKYIISTVNFRLTKKNHPLKIDYKPLKELIENKNILNPTIKNISDLVKEIRTSKLPDPQIVGNCGSFFKNPIVNKNKFDEILNINKSIPFYKLSNKEFKIPAAWLIEKCGMKGVIDGETGTHNKHALVIINLGNATGLEIYTFSQKIKNLVLKKFNILLEEEVNVIE